jgi:spore coat polysaccharide biosynthesis protein SpsF
LHQSPWLCPYSYAGDRRADRYLRAAQAFNVDLIVRIPGDKSCVEPAFIDKAVRSYFNRAQVYVSNTIVRWEDRKFIDGLGAEVFSTSRIKWLDQHTTGCAPYREHPHLYFQDQHLIEGWELYQQHANLSETLRLT